MIRIPGLLHDVLGERQSPLALVLVAAPCVLGLALWGQVIVGSADVALWRKALALLLFIDIAAGAVANLTRGTNAFYAARPRNRWVFIAVHLHLIAFAALLALPLAPYVAVWAYTISATIILNLLATRQDQRVLAGALVAIGWMILPLMALEPVGLMASALFIFKLCFAFAVNHDRELEK
jgi:hypothetical protein